MQNILVMSQKGGCGKSTIADELAFALERRDVPFAFYSLDEQGDSLHETQEPDDARVAVIDTPGSLSDDTPDMIRDADVIVVPTRASGRDMTALQRTRDLIANTSPDVPVIIVMNGWNRWNNAKDFRAWLEDDLRDAEQILTLSQSDNIPKAEAAGESVIGYAPRSKSYSEIVNIITAVFEKLEGVPHA